ncbi:cupin domain-containing protein [Flagellimonas sp.]|uniref:cupin domain-containing protein n=1 Tax=Flagellimonas sp. TaxID=2058762 RepID=UPI003F4A402D
MKKNTKNTEPYSWGENCKGWEFVRDSSLSIIEELMPPNTSETKHYHSKSQQFFYILKGEAAFYINNELHKVNEREGIQIPAKTVHQIRNNGLSNLEFLVISQPTSRGDRFEVT